MGMDIAADRKEKARAEEKSAKKAAANLAKTEKRKKQHAKYKAGLNNRFPNTGSHVCTQCGKQAKPKLITKGNIFIEIILWICFLFPGLIYSIWRHISRIKGCPDCKTQTMIKADSPVGKKLLD